MTTIQSMTTQQLHRYLATLVSRPASSEVAHNVGTAAEKHLVRLELTRRSATCGTGEPPGASPANVG